MGYNRIQGDTGGTGGTIRQKKGRDMWMYFQLKRGLFDGLLTTTFLGNNKMVLRKPHLRKFKTTKILLKLSSFFFFNVDMGKLEIFSEKLEKYEQKCFYFFCKIHIQLYFLFKLNRSRLNFIATQMKEERFMESQSVFITHFT